MEDWNSLLGHIEEKYPYLEDLKVCSNKKWIVSSLHQFVKIAHALAAGTIFSSENKRLAILFPEKNDVGFWISIFCVLESIKRDYHKTSRENLNFRKGEIIEYRNCILRYEGEVEIDGDLKVCVSCSDLREYFPASWAGIVPRFQRCETNRPLSPYKKLGRAIKNDKKEYTEDKHGTLDKLLNIRSYGNKTIYQSNILLNSPKGKIINKLNHSYINKALISEMILWYGIDSEGNFLDSKGQLKGNPVMVVSGDLYSSRNYLNNNYLNTNGIVIDVPNLNSVTDNLQMLDDILSNQIPVIIFSNIIDGENIRYLKERKFLIWQWNNDYINSINSLQELQKYTIFYEMLCNLYNYSQRQIRIRKCKCSILHDVEKITYKINKSIKENDIRAERIFSKLINSFLEFSRLIYIPPNSDIDEYINKIEAIENDIELHSAFISENILREFNQYLEYLKIKIDELSKGINAKADFINDVILKNSKKNLLVICPNEKTISNIRRHQSDNLNNGLKFISYTQYLDYGNLKCDNVMIPGWLGKNRMQKIFSNWDFKYIMLLTYDFEQKWYEGWKQNWDKYNNYRMKAEDFADIFYVSSEEISFIDLDVKTKAPKSGKRLKEYDPELVLKRNRYSSHIYSGLSNNSHDYQESIEAIPVLFEGGYYTFFTESHSISDASAFFQQLSSQKPEIKSKSAKELKSGDHIIIRESNKDIIREIADEILKNSNLENVRDEAMIWKKDLTEYYKKTNGNFKKLIKQLREKGCDRHEVTIRNWLNSDHIIAPDLIEDIISIAKVCNDYNLENGIEDVEKAIRTVRGAHLQAGSYLSGKLIKILPSILDDEQKSNRSEEIISFELDEYGTVKILCVEEIGEKININISSLNRIFREE